MSELGVLWYKKVSSVCAFFVLILLLMMESLELGNYIWNLVSNESDPSSPPGAANDIRTKIVFLLKVIWSPFFLWFIIKSSIGIRKKKPSYMLPYLLAQAFLLIMIIVRLILLIWSKKLNFLNDEFILAALRKNLYWKMSCKIFDSPVDRTLLSTLLQIGVNCSFVVVVYFCYEVLRYEAVRPRQEGNVGNVRLLYEYECPSCKSRQIIVL